MVPTAAKVAFVDALSAAGHRVDRGLGASSRRNGCRRWPTPPRCSPAITRRDGRSLHGAGAEPGRARPGARPRACATSRSSPRRPRRSASAISTSPSTSRSTPTVTSCAAARTRGMRVRGYLSTCFGCPFEGTCRRPGWPTSPSRLLELGVFEVAISDTIGVAHPGQVAEVLDAVPAHVPVPQLALHLHDTRGTALANVLAGLRVRRHDLRQRRRRPRRLSLRARRVGQSRHRGPALHAGWDGDRERCFPGWCRRRLEDAGGLDQPPAAVEVPAGRGSPLTEPLPM